MATDESIIEVDVGEQYTAADLQLSPAQRNGERLVSAQLFKQSRGSPLKGMRVSFQNLSYTVPNRAKKKEQLTLLTNVSGILEPGEMMALMGPSGSGKTTLMDILAGRKTQGKITGGIRFGGKTVSKTFLMRYTGYVEQFDTLIDNFTVRDMLLYTAELKLDYKTVSKAKKQKIVNDVIEALSLEKCQHTIIGNSLNRGISGGQSKRTNIGLALVTKPRVLFLDEPTSGLDSYTANQVMDVVQRLTSRGISICATIHSPSQFAFSLFDKVMILLSGHVAYFGPVKDGVEPYLRAAMPDAGGVGEKESVAEWITSVTTQADREGKAEELARMRRETVEYQEQEKLLNTYMGCIQSDLATEALKELDVTEATVTPFWWALKVLLQYRTSRNFKDPAYLGPRLGDKFLTSFIIATLYHGLGSDDSPASAINIVQVLFMWTVMPGFGAAAYVPTMVLERPLYVRERNDGLYRPFTYLCGKMLEEVILTLVSSFVFACLVYFPVELQGDFLVFWLGYFTTLSIGIALAYTIAGACPNMESANAAVPAYVVTLLFFAGNLIRWDDIPSFWKWYGYLDFIRYGWGAQMQNQFSGQNVAIIGGEEVLQFYSLDGISSWGFLGIEFAFFAFFFFASWLVLAFKKHSNSQRVEHGRAGHGATNSGGQPQPSNYG